MSEYVDAHCHLDLYPDFAGVASYAEGQSTRVLAMTTTPRAYNGNLVRAAPYRSVTVGLGLHPQVVAASRDDLDLFDSLVDKAVIIGEVGLDASPRYFRSIDEQERAFAHIVGKTVTAGGRPVSIHAVRSVTRVLRIIDGTDPKRLSRYAIHWFSGGTSELRRALDSGCYFSVNIAMSRSKNGASLLQALPFDRVLTETDGPFIEKDGVALQPPDVRGIVDVLANIWKLPHEDVVARVFATFKRFMTP